MQSKTLNMLGLAKRAGQVKSGGYQVEQAIAAYRARLVIVAGDASENTWKHISDMCRYRHIPIARQFDKEALGHCLGQGDRSCLAITDDHLAKAVRQKMEEEGYNLECEGE